MGSVPLGGFPVPFCKSRGAFWMQNMVARSGYRTVIVCHCAFSSILDPRRHPRIPKNHQILGGLYQNSGKFHIIIHGNLHFRVGSWCHCVILHFLPFSVPGSTPGSLKCTILMLFTKVVVSLTWQSTKICTFGHKF